MKRMFIPQFLLKEQCHKIFNPLFGLKKKTVTGLHMNGQKQFREDIRKNVCLLTA